MRPTGQFFVGLLFLNLNGFFIFHDGLVSALSDSPLEIGKNIIKDAFDPIKIKNPFEDFIKLVKPIEDESIRVKSSIAKDASSWFVKSVKTAIEATSKYCKHQKPLTFFTAMDETCLVNQTGKSLRVTVLNPITVATMTGGILGNDIFEFQEYSFAWQDSSCNTTHNLEAQVVYRNLKYDSFEKALDYPDGIAMVIFPVSTNGDFPNLKFNQFSNFLQTHIKEPGHCATIDSAPTYTWFVNFPFGSVYHTYTMPYWDPNTGKITKAIVIELPLDQRVNYIGKDQFQKTFAKMGHISGKMSQDNGNLSPVERQKGIVVLYLHA